MVAGYQCQWGVWGGRGPQVNKFEKVSGDDHQMSLAGGGSLYSDFPCLEGSHVRSGSGAIGTR